jgi:hypothetical protein
LPQPEEFVLYASGDVLKYIVTRDLAKNHPTINYERLFIRKGVFSDIMGHIYTVSNHI